MRCARCDAELAGKAVGGLCPVCLLDAASFEEFAGADSSFRYELIEEIARGGMGVVYRATQHGSNRQVAVKMILTDLASAPGMLERFRAEAEAIASLDHPHILPIYEVGEHEGAPFYSMKLASGGSLREHGGAFQTQPRQAAMLIAQVARAVHHAHQRGILHRDLKPGNILLDGAEQTPYVSDFGIAKWLGRDSALTLLATALGTPNYMAPEQAGGASRELTTAADIYSLGAILYELLSGHPPFVAETALETLRLAAETEPSPLLNAPRDLATICLKCLAKEPAARYASAELLASDLERWLEGRTIIARPATTSERLWRWMKRNPALATVSAAAVALVIAFSIGSTIAAARLRISNQRAVAAEQHAREQLRTASLAEAKALVQSGGMGQRFGALAALKRAGEVRVDADLRTQAFAALMLPDIKVDQTWSDRYASSSPAAFDSTLTRYVVESAAGKVSLRRAADHSEIAALQSPTGNPRAIYIAPFSVDDSKIAVRFANDLVRVYDIASARVLFDIAERPLNTSGRAFAYDFGFTPDGRELFVAMPAGGASFHDANDGRETGRLVSNTVASAIAVSPDGSRIALVGKENNAVEIYGRASNELEHTLVHGDVVFHLAWRPNSTQLATSARDDKIYLWDAVSGQRLQTLQGHEGIPPQLAFHPDGKLLASSARDFSVRFWDVESGACVLNAHGLYGEPCLRFSRDGTQIGLGSEGTKLSTATFAFNAPCREFFRCASGDWYSRVSGMRMSADGTLVAITLRSFGVHLLAADTGKVLAQLPLWPGERKTAVFSPASDALLVSGDVAGLWMYPLARGADQSLSFGTPRLIDARPGFLVTDAQGSPPVAALSGAKLGKFSVVPLENPASPIDLDVKSTPASAHLSPDARLVATDDWEGDTKGESDVRIWNTATGELIRRLDVGANNSVRMSASGKLLAACGTNAGAGLWRLPEIARDDKFQPRGEDAWFAPGDRLLGALNEGSLDLIRISDGALLGSFPGDAALSVVFSPDGSRMLLGTNSRFYEWDLVATRREIAAAGLDWRDP